MHLLPLFSFTLLLSLISSCVPWGDSCQNIAKKKIKVLSKFSHNSSSFTQGLLIDNGIFYESSGGYGNSFLTTYDKSKVLKKEFLSSDIFAEGLSEAMNELYLLTWRAEKVIIFDKDSLKFKRERVYKGEGWGLASKDNKFYMSNGTDLIKVFDKSFNLIEKIKVRHVGQELKLLNELEFIKETLYANIWQSSKIVGINIKKGCVVEEIDASEITKNEAHWDANSVLNGIAYDKNRGDIYLTGKNWKYIYQVQW